MTPAPICPECGATVMSDARRGVCPRCAVRRAMEPLPADDEPGNVSSRGIHLLMPDGTTAVPLLREFGDYEIVEEIGHGGMGVIFKARQKSLDRIVAVKLIRAGSIARPGDIARFQTEAAAAARLQHPHIVAIYEVGEHEGQHFYSMEFVPGRSLAQELREGPFAPREAARLLLAVAEAIQFAHQRGVLHRDLKPSNILLDAGREPRVADFGLAKILQSDSELTLSGAVIGSPQYMPPEQARGRSAKAGSRSDVYSLGAILYELLTGRPPFNAPTPLETMKLVVEQEPIAPRALNPALPLDLETICLKCLAKEPSARYASAQELADELARYLRDEPIHARRVSTLERAWRWCRRKPALAALLLVAVVAPAIIITVLLLSGAKIARERDNAKAAHQEARGQEERALVNLFAADMKLAQIEIEEGNLKAARELLNRHRPDSPSATDRRGFEWRWLWAQSQGDDIGRIPNFTNQTECLALSPDGRWLAVAGTNGLIWQYSISGQPLSSFRPTNFCETITSLRFSPDGRTLGIVGTDRREPGMVVDDQRALIWDLATHRELFRWGPTKAPLPLLAFSPRSNLVACVESKTNGAEFVSLRDWNDGRVASKIPGGGQPEQFTPDGNLLLKINGGSMLWNVQAQAVIRKFGGNEDYCKLSPDGRWLARTKTTGPQIELQDLHSVTAPVLLKGHTASLRLLVFSPDSRLLVSGGGDLITRVWDLESQTEITQLRGLSPGPEAVHFLNDNETLASAGVGVKFFHAHKPTDTLGATNLGPYTAVFSPDCRTLAGVIRGPRAGGTGVRSRVEIVLADLPSGELKHFAHITNAEPIAFSADGKQLHTIRKSSEGLWLQTWDCGSGESVTNRLLALDRVTDWLWDLQASPDGKYFAYGRDDGSVRIWEMESGNAIGDLPATGVQEAYLCFSPDSQMLAVGYVRWPKFTSWFKFWDWRARREIAVTPSCQDDVRMVKFSPDGRQFVTGRADHTARMYDPRTAQELAVLSGFKHSVYAVAYAPDGRSLALALGGGSVLIWDLAAKREVVRLFPEQNDQRNVHWLEFTCDGRWLVGLDQTGTIRRWYAPDFSETER